MKKSIFTQIILLACVLSPLHAYEYFTIYFSDGTKSEAFYAVDVDSICYSKLSLDSIEYADWQVQEIYTCDSVYRYPLALIDSLSFKDVDVNQVAEDIARVSAVLNPLYLKCHSTTEISHHLPLIENIEGVEKTWVDSQTLFVKIRNWETISYQYPVKSVNMPESINNPSLCQSRGIYKNINTSNVLTHRHLYKKDVCIVNQHYKDIDYVKSNEAADTLKKWCSKLGLNVTVNNSPSPEFFAHDIYKYGLVFIFTHGMYNGKHWLATSEEIYTEKIDNPINSDSLRKVADSFIHENYFKKGLSPTDINYVVSTENRGGDTVLVCNTWISNSYISKQGVSDSQETIIFNIACQSMKGNQEMGNAFINNGAVCYSGFSEVNTIGQGCSLFYLESLLSGYSSYTAVKTLPDGWWKEKVEWPEGSGNYNDSELILWPTNQNVTSVCITHPETLSQDTLEGDSESIIIKGRMKTFNSNLVDSIGFLVADNPEMDKANRYKAIAKQYDSETYYMNWEATLDVSKFQSNTTYYYCAYMFDGYSYCYGEVKSFSIFDDLYSEPYCVLTDRNLTFYYDSFRESREGQKFYLAKQYNRNPAWSDETIRDKIEKVVFDYSFSNYRPTSTAYWFYCLCNLKEIKNIGNLNTDNVTNMSAMFCGCSAMESIDVSNFNTGDVTDMSYMFDGCNSLVNLNVSNFNTSNVTNMSVMFGGCSAMERIDVSNFNTGEVTDMNRMFCGCSAMERIDVSNFNTGEVTDMRHMFAGCSAMERIDVSNFNTGKVTDMSYMFAGCSAMERIDVGNFNTGKVTNMSYMFSECSALERIDVSNFNTGKVTNMSNMFSKCSALERIDVSNFNTGEVTNMSYMFMGCNSLENLNVNGFKTGKVTNMNFMFMGCSSLKELNLSDFNTSNVTGYGISDLSYLFEGCSSLENLNLCNFTFNNLVGGIFMGCITLKSLDMSRATFSGRGYSEFLSQCTSLKYINVSNAKVIGDASYLFDGLMELESIDLTNFNTSEATNMCCMFRNCRKLKVLDLSSFIFNYYYVGGMFENCYALTTIYAGNWNTKSSAQLFENCNSLVGSKGTKLGQNLYGYDEKGKPLYYHCYPDGRSAHIDGGKDNPGLFTAK